MANYKVHLESVKEHLNPNESIKYSIFGAYECKIFGGDSIRDGILVALENRVVVFSIKLTGYDLESFPFDKISSIEMSKEFLGKKITLFASGNKVCVKHIQKGDIDVFIEYVRDHIGKQNNIPVIQESIPDQIKKLSELRDQKILTEEEFTAKKTDLLSRM